MPPAFTPLPSLYLPSSLHTHQILIFRPPLQTSSRRPLLSAADPPTTAPSDQPPQTKRRQRTKPATSPRPNPSATRFLIRQTFKRAQSSERVGNIPKARSCYLQCLAMDRRDAHSWLALARLESRAGSNSKGVGVGLATGAKVARSLFAEGLRECPDSVHLLQAWAVLEHKCGNRDKARVLFKRGNEIEPENPYISHAWGLLEQRVGNTDKARDLFKKTVDLRPHSEVCAAWAMLEAREGNVGRARELFEQGLSSCKGERGRSVANICRLWAEMEERLGELPKAREMLTKAISCEPAMTEAYIALANLEARRGCTTRSLELMGTAAGLDETPPAAVFNAWAKIELVYRRNVDQARVLLKRGIKMHPADQALLQSLGIVEEKSGNIDDARGLFRKSVELKPTAPAFVAWALLEERDGNSEESKRLFEEALATDAVHGAAYNAYGMMEARRGRLDEAREVYERGLKLFASSSVCHGYGQLELKLGRNPDRARELFRQGVGHTREDTAFIWHSWGMLELAQKNVVDAREIFRDALKRYPRNSRILVGAALAEAASCQRTGADECTARNFFKRAVGADPTHAHAWQAWGVFELRMGREDAGQALFRRGLRLCPTHGALWQAWGVLEMSRGNFGRARKLFERGTESCPNHVHLYQAWACMEVRAGNFDRARQLLDHALGFDANHGPVWNAYGLLEAQHGTLARARQIFVTGIKRSPNHAPLYRTFGQTEARVGNYDRARDLYKRGLQVDPRHAPLYHTLAKLEAMVGNVEGLAELKKEAEKYFGSEADAVQAMRSGDETHAPPHEDVSLGGEHLYGSITTPMEYALEGLDVCPQFEDGKS